MRLPGIEAAQQSGPIRKYNPEIIPEKCEMRIMCLAFYYTHCCANWFGVNDCSICFKIELQRSSGVWISDFGKVLDI